MSSRSGSRATSPYYSARNVTWEDDKMVTTQTIDLVSSMVYGSPCSAGFFPLNVMLVDGGNYMLLIAHPELAGMRSKQLPKSLTWIYDDEQTGQPVEEIMSFTYELDSKGYISKIHICYSTGELSSYTLTWK